MRSFHFAVVLLVLAVSTQVEAEVFTGTASGKGWAFLGKFCFDNDSAGKQTGSINLKLNTKLADKPDLAVLLYSDQSEFWGQVYDRTSYKLDTCTERRKYAKNLAADGVSVTPDYRIQNGQAKGWQDDGTYENTWPFTQKARPHFWYVVLTNLEDNCDEFKDIDYEVHFTATSVSSWDEEFSLNQMGLNTLYLVYFFVYVAFLLVHLIGVWKLRASLSYVHPLVRLFTIIVGLQFISVFCYLCHWGNIARDGTGVAGAYHAAEVIDMFARVQFITLLLLLAKGWTISNEELSHRALIVGSGVFFMVMQLCILIWKYAVLEPESTEPSLAVEVMTFILGAGWILYAFVFMFFIKSSYSNEDQDEKRTLYVRIGIVYSIWFLMYPAILYGSLALDPWVQDKLTMGMNMTMSTVAYFIMSFMLWPSRAEKYFAISTPDVSKSLEHYNPL